MQHLVMGRVGAVVAGAAVLITLGGVGGAVAGSLVSSADIKDESVRARDIGPGAVTRSEVRDATLGIADLSAYLQNQVTQRAQDGADGTDGVAGLESDGARPGVTQLSEFPGNGENSTTVWAAGPAGKIHTSWVMCPPGKTALGGGFSRDTQSAAALRGLQVVTSAPAQIDTAQNDDPATAADERVVSMGEGYTPIAGDAAKSFVPNGWVVEGFNNANTDQVVRVWVTCATVNN